MVLVMSTCAFFVHGAMNEGGIIEVSQAGSSSVSFATDLTLLGTCLEVCLNCYSYVSRTWLGFLRNRKRFGSWQNGKILGLLELISQFDPCLACQISKYGNSGKGNPSYLSKTTCEELIQLMAQTVHAFIVDEVNLLVILVYQLIQHQICHISIS